MSKSEGAASTWGALLVVLLQGKVSVPQRHLQILSLWSCRGERIVYELALQELFIAYSGYGGKLATRHTMSCVVPIVLDICHMVQLLGVLMHILSCMASVLILRCCARDRRGPELLSGQLLRCVHLIDCESRMHY